MKTLVDLEVLLLDESSMLDGDGYSAIEEVLSITDHNRRPNGDSHDAIGNMHLLLFGDFKQLPPATSKPSFIVIPSVTRDFEFRCLRENRRVVTDQARRDEIEESHRILTDISWGIASDVVKNFIVQAYVRGAVVGNAEHCELENSTAVFTKRRYRDRWNRIIVRRVAGTHNHTLKIKARLRAKGVRGQQYYSEAKTSWIRKRARTQNLWLLQLAGDWHPCHEVKTPHTRPHLMRCMLVSNLAVDQVLLTYRCSEIFGWTEGGISCPNDINKSICYKL